MLLVKSTLLILALVVAANVMALALGMAQPHGSVLAYFRQMHGIVVLDTARSLSARLVRHHASLLPLSWTPDGSAVLYLKPNRGESDVYAASLDGGEIRLTNSIRVATFAVSADGQNIALTLRRSDGIYELAAGKLGAPPQRVAVGSSPSWSPDGRRLAFVASGEGRSEIYVYDGAADIRSVSQHPMNDFEPVWSPDGRQLVFNSMRDGDRELYLADVDSGTLHRLTKDPAEDYNAVWSPDGTRLAFVASIYGISDLYVMTLADGTVRRLTRHGYLSRRAQFRPPTWSHDGRWLAFESARTGASELYLTDVETGSTRQLTFDGDNFYPVWQP